MASNQCKQFPNSLPRQMQNKATLKTLSCPCVWHIECPALLRSPCNTSQHSETDSGISRTALVRARNWKQPKCPLRAIDNIQQRGRKKAYGCKSPYRAGKINELQVHVHTNMERNVEQRKKKTCCEEQIPNDSLLQVSKKYVLFRELYLHGKI